MCGVDESFGVSEELAVVVLPKGTTKGSDLLEAVMTTINRLKFNLKSISGVTTDGAPSSSVARGGGYSPPIGMSTKMQNRKNTFLALLRLFMHWSGLNNDLKHLLKHMFMGGANLSKLKPINK